MSLLSPPEVVSAANCRLWCRSGEVISKQSDIFPFSSTFYEFFFVCVYTQLLLVSAGPARLGVPLHLFCAARGWDAFLISQKSGSGRRHAPLSLRLLAPGFLYFCAAPEGALRCVNRMLMANYAPALASFVRRTPRNHPFSRPSAGLFQMRNSWCRDD